MVYNDMPVIIPLLATGYLLTIYLLLMLAQWTMKSSRYVANSLSDAYAPSLPEDVSQKDDVERWTLRVQRYPTARYLNVPENSAVALLGKRGAVASRELAPELFTTDASKAVSDHSMTTLSHVPKVQEVSRVS
jgi:hypothetical protein